MGDGIRQAGGSRPRTFERRGGALRAQQRLFQRWLFALLFEQGQSHDARRKPQAEAKPETAAHDSLSEGVDAAEGLGDGTDEPPAFLADAVSGYKGSVIDLIT